MENWGVILDSEALFIDEVGKRLDEIGHSIDSGSGQGNQAIETCYAAMKSAYDLAVQEYQNFEGEIEWMESAGSAGQINVAFLPPHIQQQIMQSPPQFKPALAQLVICFRVCMRRPSDVFKEELRRQIGSIVGGIQQTIMSGTVPPQQAEQDAKSLCVLLCAIEQPFESSPSADQDTGFKWSNLLSWQGLLTIAGSAALGYFALPPAIDWLGEKTGLLPSDEDGEFEESVAVEAPFPDEMGDRVQNEDGADFLSEEFDEDDTDNGNEDVSDAEFLAAVG